MSVRFPRWTNALPTLLAGGAFFGLVSVVWGTWYWATPDFWEVGYMPRQPGSGFSHQIHAGKLGLDCRYCHTKIESSSEANIPNVATCNGCHAAGRVSPDFARTAQTQFIRDAYDTNVSIEWRRVHKLPDYVRNFPHNIHVKAGVSCFSCHGQITAMPDVYQAHGIGMGWCLDCHRNAEEKIVGKDMVTRLVEVEHEMAERARGQGAIDGGDLFRQLQLKPPQNCGACHY